VLHQGNVGPTWVNGDVLSSKSWRCKRGATKNDTVELDVPRRGATGLEQAHFAREGNFIVASKLDAGPLEVVTDIN